MLTMIICLSSVGAAFLFRNIRHKKVTLIEDEKDKLQGEFSKLTETANDLDNKINQINKINSLKFEKSDVTKNNLDKVSLSRQIQELMKIKQGLQSAYDAKKRKEQEEEEEKRRKARAAAALLASRRSSSSSSSYSSGSRSGGSSWGGGGGGFSGGGSSGSW